MSGKAMAQAPWPTPLQGLWKSRSPLIVLPMLWGLRRLSPSGGLVARGSLGGPWEALLLVAAALGSGYKRLPFSAMWWLVLLLAFALETELLLGAATVLSLTVLLGWYGVRLRHPQAVSALWGGTRGGKKWQDEDGNAKGGPEGDRWLRIGWQVWDLVVHGLPATLVLYWHGPGITPEGALAPGTVTLGALAAVLPLNVLWLWGLGLGLKGPTGGDGGHGLVQRLWPWGLRLEDTNLAYRVAPAMPQAAWRWIYGSHWVSCVAWAGLLLLPAEATLAFGVFAACGVCWLPYTTGWWLLFVGALRFGDSRPLLQGIACCCGATTSLGFYGCQMLAPYSFRSLVTNWVVEPAARLGPRWFSARFKAFSETLAFWAMARTVDLFVHLLPTATAVCIFRHQLTVTAVLISLPTNFLWLLCATGQATLRRTNDIYGVEPNLPDYVWRYIFGSHWAFCGAALLGLAFAQ